MPTCVNHPETETAMACAGCSRPLCHACLVDFQGTKFCGYCRDGMLARMQGARQAPPPASQPSVTDHLIPTKNAAALTGYYLGVFSFIPCAGNFLGPAAIIAGVMGLRARKRDPQLPGTAHAVIAIVLGTFTTLGYWGLTIFFLTQMR